MLIRDIEFKVTLTGMNADISTEEDVEELVMDIVNAIDRAGYGADVELSKLGEVYDDED